MLGKAKALFQLIGRRSIRGADREIHREFPGQSTTGRTAPETEKPDQIQNRSSEFDNVDKINVDRLGSTVSKEIPIPDFEVEVSAEDYFFANQGKQAQGTFQEVDAVRWEHDEADWNIKEFDFQPSDNVSNPSLAPSPMPKTKALQDTKRPTQKEIRSSILRVRLIASK